MSSYLNDRHQTTQVGAHVSKKGCCTNSLSLNVKKPNFDIFRPYQKRVDYEVNINIRRRGDLAKHLTVSKIVRKHFLKTF